MDDIEKAAGLITAIINLVSTIIALITVIKASRK